MDNLSDLSLDDIVVDINYTRRDIINLIDAIPNINQQTTLYKIFNDFDSHKFYIIESIYNTNDFEIKLLGGLNKKNIRNNYFITLDLQDKTFKCSCKDFIYRSNNNNNTICKHISFLIFRVTRLFFNTNFNWTYTRKTITIFLETKKLTEKQFNQFTDNFKLHNNTYTLQNLNKQFKNSLQNNYNLLQNTLCPICLIKFNNNKSLLQCPKCNNNVHEECMNIWLQCKKTCVYCRNDIWKNYNKELGTHNILQNILL